MATAKQLAALKKARAAKKAKSATKRAPKRKSNPTRVDYVVYVLEHGRRYYFDGLSGLDDDVSKARGYANKYAADAAAQVLMAFGRKARVAKK